MVIRAHTSDGDPIHVSMPPWFAWLSGILATVITVVVISTAAKLVNMDQRVVILESQQIRPEDYVQRREYEATLEAIRLQIARIEGSLIRIEDKLDER